MQKPKDDADSGNSVVIDVSSMSAAGDYTVVPDVFEAAQIKWGICTIDAFASPTTQLLPNFWTKKPFPGMPTDAFKQDWAAGERIWAHPPPECLPELVAILKREDRKAEVLVCVPYWPHNGKEWFYPLLNLIDDKVKYMSGKLVRVADDAPERLHEWPILVCRVPARKGCKSPPRSHSPLPH